MFLPLAAPAAFSLGGLGRRVAGGAFQQWTGLNIGDLPVRVFFALTVGASGYAGGMLWWHALVLAAATLPGTMTGNFNSMAMGRGTSSLLHDIFGMTAHGVLSALLPALGCWYAGYSWIWVAAAGLLAAPSYMLGWSATGRAGKPGWPLGLRSGTEIAEMVWGGLCGLGALLAAGHV
jgi:hypothetical protein